jgi:hypothetical protein
MIDEAGRAAATARIDAHAGVVVRHPFLGIDHFPALVEVARSCGDVRVLFGHALPRTRIAVLEGETLGVGSIAQNHRIAAVLHRTEDVGAQHHAVVHLDRHVPVNAHAVAHLAAILVGLATRWPGARFLDRSHAVLHSHPHRGNRKVGKSGDSTIYLPRVLHALAHAYRRIFYHAWALRHSRTAPTWQVPSCAALRLCSP